MAKKATPDLPFDEQLVLFQYFLHELGVESIDALSDQLNRFAAEGLDESGHTRFSGYLAALCALNGAHISPDKLRLYDENIRRHTRQLGEKRGGLVWKYFQYVALLFTEMYLDRYFSDREGFCAELNAWLEQRRAKTLGRLTFGAYTPEKMNKLAFMCATGSGKTLIMHMNILQFLHYLRRAQRTDSRLSINKVIVLSPNEGMSQQHLAELGLSSISAALFEKDRGFDQQKGDVIVIDMNKLKEEGRVKTVAVDSFEQNNLVLVDEGHRGLSGNIWYDYRTRLSADGFAFEYSATFRQALNAASRKEDERALREEYGKSILMDYSYKYFYRDGYGKDYRIYNLGESIDRDHQQLYLTGCLLSFYQQLKLFQTKREDLRPFQIEKPLLVFVGNRVTASTSAAELTDVEEVLNFIDQFVRRRKTTMDWIQTVLFGETGLTDGAGNEIFYQDFNALHELFGSKLSAQNVYEDLLRTVFNAQTVADEPRLRMENIRQVPGEIGLKIGQYGSYFGVISIGDTAGLMKKCREKDIAAKTEEFISESLFREINTGASGINMLIGSRKFSEGWNSWRVSTMGLINCAKGEGAQAIQLFGRGVRLKGLFGGLKRSHRLEDCPVPLPKYIDRLETLTIFGVKAQYMEDFKKYLELEGAPPNDSIQRFTLKAKSRFGQLGQRKLFTIRVREGANFKKQAGYLVLDVPDEGFRHYLGKNKTVIDCRSRVQTIDSTLSLSIPSVPRELTLPAGELPYLDYERIFLALERHKKERYYYNISIVREKLMDILKAGEWYALLIPPSHLKINSLAKLEAATDYAIRALESYMDKFYRYEKARWEEPLLEYAALEEKDANFVDAYTITYARQNALDTVGDELGKTVAALNDELERGGGLERYETEAARGGLAVFDYPGHLYAPLVCQKKSGLRLQVTPVGLNEDEKRFVDRLKDYAESHAHLLADKGLFLLRNKSKTGVGFFTAGNFYPDYMLWVDTPEVQYLSFIDPKGLVYVDRDDAKIRFYETIKEEEARLAPTEKGKRMVLNSFIMAKNSAAKLRELWGLEREEQEKRHVLTLDDPQCVEKMMNMILEP